LKTTSSQLTPFPYFRSFILFMGLLHLESCSHLYQNSKKSACQKNQSAQLVLGLKAGGIKFHCQNGRALSQPLWVGQASALVALGLAHAQFLSGENPMQAEELLRRTYASEVQCLYRPYLTLEHCAEEIMRRTSKRAMERLAGKNFGPDDTSPEAWTILGSLVEKQAGQSWSALLQQYAERRGISLDGKTEGQYALPLKRLGLSNPRVRDGLVISPFHLAQILRVRWAEEKDWSSAYFKLKAEESFVVWDDEGVKQTLSYAIDRARDQLELRLNAEET
jgi:hypothetical protein